MKTVLRVLAAILVLALVAGLVLRRMTPRGLRPEGKQPGNAGRLGSLRSALGIYYGNENGQYPASLDALVVGGKTALLAEIPENETSHGRSRAVQLLSAEQRAAGAFSDAGGWAYVVSGRDAGAVFINCTHTDTRGRAFTAY